MTGGNGAFPVCLLDNEPLWDELCDLMDDELRTVTTAEYTILGMKKQLGLRSSWEQQACYGVFSYDVEGVLKLTQRYDLHCYPHSPLNLSALSARAASILRNLTIHGTVFGQDDALELPTWFATAEY